MPNLRGKGGKRSVWWLRRSYSSCTGSYLNTDHDGHEDEGASRDYVQCLSRKVDQPCLESHGRLHRTGVGREECAKFQEASKEMKTQVKRPECGKR